MPILDCSPPYSYRPTFSSSGSPLLKSKAPSFFEHRSRLFAGGTFFRSKLIISSIEVQGLICNDISVESSRVSNGAGSYTYTISVNFQGNPVESYIVTQNELASPPCSNNPIDTIRNNINLNSNYISMPARSTDAFDIGGTDDECWSTFAEISMSGGSGGPSDGATIATIRTGPERTVFILSSTEDANGYSSDPPAERKVQQWDGVTWITYTPNADCHPV